MSHTPTPWNRNIRPASKYNTVYSGRNTHVLALTVSGLPPEEVESNMEFLIKAVNAHDDLVAALKRAEHGLCINGSENENSISHGQLLAVRAALAKVAA